MRSQNSLAPISFTLAVLVSQLGVMPFAAAIPNPIDHGRSRKESLPDVPSTPPPSGNRQPGGSLSGDLALCPEKPQPLTAITPVNVQGKTLENNPTFWFYMPYTADEVAGGDFSILTRDETERIYETSFALPAEPGMISITVPEEVAIMLENGQYYHWYLNVSCLSSEEAETDLNIDGWVQRVSSAPQDSLSPEIWYDMVDQLAGELQVCSAVNKADIKNRWANLLSSVDLDELSEEPVIGPVILTDD